jgi:hypothetical protein
MLAIAKSQKNRTVYECKCCDYTTCNSFDFDKHSTTAKHKNNSLAIKTGDLAINMSQKSQETKFICDTCYKGYKDNSGLWRHKKKCKLDYNSDAENKPSNEPTDKDLIMLLIKENSELKTMMMKVLENGTTHNTTNNTNNTNNTNSHNKAFNLNFFLNETCKDAMNITEFVESIKLQLSDLERVGELGYVEGISNIIVKNLKDLDVTQRPVHCTDKKRETMYIKDEDKWEKDDEQKKMHKMVRKVADKNARMVPKFKEAHPDCGKSSSRFSDQYNKIIMEAMGGRGDNDFEKEEKIIKRVSKEVVVEKEDA